MDGNVQLLDGLADLRTDMYNRSLQTYPLKGGLGDINLSIPWYVWVAAAWVGYNLYAGKKILRVPLVR